MSKAPPVKNKSLPADTTLEYANLLGDLSQSLESARRASARTVNSIMTPTYWEFGRRIVEFEQGGAKRAAYGKALLDRLARDLSERYGRGFARPNLIRFRQFYLAFPAPLIRSTASNESAIARRPIRSTTSSELVTPVEFRDLARAFPLPWSLYVLLVSRARSPDARAFYHAEALRGGWTVRHLTRQMDTQFYERTALSKNKAAMLTKGAKPEPGDAVSADEEIRDPLVLEFLGLRDEYPESDLKDALIRHLETFLLELGNDFAFIRRQRRLRIDDEWYRVDLRFFHRRLRCLVIFDLKLGRFTHADAGQMNVYLNYAHEHWSQPGENPPVGVILCSGKGEALVRYATDTLPTKMLVREYPTALPDEKVLAVELENTRRQLEAK